MPKIWKGIDWDENFSRIINRKEEKLVFKKISIGRLRFEKPRRSESKCKGDTLEN